MFNCAREIQDQLVSWRRDFHAHPELGFHEHRTAEKVANILTGLGYRVRTQVGGTGVVAEKGEGHPIAAVRADIDALPIQEENQAPYASQEPGIMHACGHDAHTAIALGAATLLAHQDFTGTVRFLFQPAEEIGDEQGISGAPHMIKDGAMEGVEAAFALHMDGAGAVGEISVEAGPCSAGVDTFYATVIGKGGHGATPQKGIDPIYLTGHVILALNAIASRRLPPAVPSVISLGSIHGGSASNVIPERVELIGTIRFMEKEIQEQIHKEVTNAFEITRALGGDFQLKWEIGYPPMYNDARMAELIHDVAVDILGADHIYESPASMGAEDFGFFSSLAPGVMFTLGCRIENDERKHHSPTFDIDENSLPYGVAMLSETVLRYLKMKPAPEHEGNNRCQKQPFLTQKFFRPRHHPGRVGNGFWAACQKSSGTRYYSFYR